MTPELIAAIIGIFLPPVISWLKGAAWSSKAKFFFSLAVCLVLGAATAYVDDPSTFTPENALAAGAAMFTAAQLVYKAYFEGTGLNARLTG